MKVSIIISIFNQLQVTLQVYEKHFLFASRHIREVRWQSGDQDVMVLNMGVSGLTNLGKTSIWRFGEKL